MWAYLVRRALMVFPVLFLVSLISFMGLELVPGDPIATFFGPRAEVTLTKEEIDALKREYGLDQPLPLRYAAWLERAVTGDFGKSIRSGRPVVEMIAEKLSVSIWLSSTTLILNVSIGVTLGVIGAVRAGGKVDLLVTAMAVSGVATPSFWVAILLIIVFAVKLAWLPASGWISPFEDPIEGIKHLILPVLSLGLFGSASIMRQTRSAMVEVLSQDFIRTARSKGLSERSIIRGHALKNALIPVVTVMAFQLAHLVGGSVLVEQVFALPGVGRLALDATITRDFPIIQAFVLMSALAIVLANFFADVMYAVLDPRIRYS